MVAPPEYVEFPAVGIRMQRPEGFERAPQFDGFLEPRTQAFVMAVRMAGPYAETSAGFTAEAMRSQGMTLLGREDITIGGQSGILVHFLQPAPGATYEKWGALFGDAENTTLVTAAFPQGAKTEALSATLKAVVVGVVQTGVPPSEALDFTVAPSDRLKPTPTMSGMLSLSKGPTGAHGPGDPLFIAAHSVAAVRVDDQGQYAAQRLLQFPQFEVPTVPPATPVTIDGLGGVELLAAARDRDTGTALVIYQVMLFDRGGYYLMLGMVGESSSAEYLAEFRRLAASFARKR